MSAEKSPAFQFYPKEFLTDGNVAAMSLQERGAYITLLCICWQEGSLPADTTRLSRIVGVPAAAFKKLWPALSVCFRQEGDRLIQGRLERERQKQRQFSEQQAERGRNRAVNGTRDEAGRLMSKPAGRQPDDQPTASQTPSRIPAGHQRGTPAGLKPDTSSPISDLRTEQEQEQEQDRGAAAALSVGTNTGKSSTAGAVRPSANDTQDPDDNVGVITKIAHTILDVLGMQTSLVDLTEGVKERCAVERIAYTSAVVAKAIDSALIQRKRKI